VHFVGQPVAFVVAETLAEAKDAAELIEVDYDALPAVAAIDQATAEGAPAVWDENPGNEGFFHEAGDAAAAEAAFAGADHVVRHRIAINRITANSMEPRGCIAEYDGVDDQYTIRCTIQSAHGTHSTLANAYFRKPQTHFRVVCDNNGTRLSRFVQAGQQMGDENAGIQHTMGPASVGWPGNLCLGYG
jgi:carbon-monoxide dehydrogenase large subunit